ncbi:MAG: hypothetical protein KAR87_04000 [Candidatus Aenigmarchaeota archaeon]|nr:hypothetical protein [Candidatus Aenigmarchaeota archaeon]
MALNISEKIITRATVAMALVAGIQGMVAFKDFSKDIDSFFGILALIVLGIFVVLACVLAFGGIMSLRKVK